MVVVVGGGGGDDIIFVFVFFVWFFCYFLRGCFFLMFRSLLLHLLLRLRHVCGLNI